MIDVERKTKYAKGQSAATCTTVDVCARTFYDLNARFDGLNELVGWVCSSYPLQRHAEIDRFSL